MEYVGSGPDMRWICGDCGGSFQYPMAPHICKSKIDMNAPAPVVWDAVKKPEHYNSHPSGVECIQITEHMNFCLGNAIKYIWRSELKGGIESLEKAVWYLQREIEKRKGKQEK